MKASFINTLLNLLWRKQIMKIRYALPVAVILAVLSLMLATPVFAADGHGCAHDPIVQSLRNCVVHAAGVGHIDSQGITKSLLAKLDAAQAALDRGQTKTAVNNLNAFVRAVEAQTDKHIVAEHADHLIMHANQVIAAIE
jgi:hypothetical protein